MSDYDAALEREERELRVELMRLDRTLKIRDLRIKRQQLTFEPLRIWLLAGGLGTGLITAFTALWKFLNP